MTPAAQVASLLAQRYVKTSPVDLMQLCKELGLKVQEVPAKGFDGALIRSKSRQKGTIAVKASMREASRKRFTIAHEIGHFVIPHHRSLKTVCDEKKIDSFDEKLNRPEVEANEFASELLLPSMILRKRFNPGEFSLAQVSEVAAAFGTSLTATIRSFLNLTALPCAMVWSHAGQARWCAKSDAFYFFIPIAELPAEGSFAGKIFRAEAVPTEFAPVSADLWLHGKAADQVNVLLEHSIALPNYNAVLTLLWAYQSAPPPAVHDSELSEELAPDDFTIHRKRWPR